MMNEVNQNSKKLSELSLGCPNDNDYIIVERKNEDGTKQSFKIKYLNFKKSIAKNIAIDNNGNMIHCNKEDFSKFSHGHDYSNFDFFPSYGPNSRNPLSDIIYLGKFDIKKYKPGYEEEYPTNQISVYTIKAEDIFINELSDYQQNQVGDIKFIAVEDFNLYLTKYLGYNIGQINGKENILLDEKFDGWVLPNGTTYDCNTTEFQDACKAFQSDKLATQFTVPDMGYFIRAKNTQGKNEFVKFQNGLQYHSHTIKTDYSQGGKYLTVECPNFTQTSTSTNSDMKNNESLHGGTGSIHKDVNVKVNITNVTFSDIKIKSSYVGNSSSGDNEECYPQHILIPCLIYIGKKN